tara:strand:+ start:637 stop:867 length:231 start_codon:yes stop_codon:yes gene_type:complete
VRRIFEEADFDQTGVINLREFSAFIQSMIQMEMSPSMMRRLFQVFDENRTRCALPHEPGTQRGTPSCENLRTQRDR